MINVLVTNFKKVALSFKITPLLLLLEIFIYFEVPSFKFLRGKIYSTKKIALLRNMEPRTFRLLIFCMTFIVVPTITTSTRMDNIFAYFIFQQTIEHIIIFLNKDTELKEKIDSDNPAIFSTKTRIIICLCIMVIYFVFSH